MNWRPHLAPPWSLTDLEAILQDALRVLEQIGVECTHQEARRRLADWPGITLRGDRMHLSPTCVQDHLKQRRAAIAQKPLPDKNRFTLGGCWAGLFYCDPLTQQVRPATSAEVAQMVRLWDARDLSGVVPLMPGDVPPGLVTLAAERIALTNSRSIGGALTVANAEEVRYLVEMNLAVGRRYQLMEQVGISPLRLNNEGLDVALAFRDHPDLDLSISGFIPMAGVTCPLDPRSAIVQTVAETLALSVLCEVLGLPGSGLRIRLEPFDFQYLSIVFGSPEWCLFRALALQMTDFLVGRPTRSGSFRSVAKRPDPQATCERTASVLWQALLGVRSFGAVGQLSVDEIFSPQQAVLDREILRYVERVIEGLDLGDEPVDALELIREGVRDKSFVGTEDTVSRYHELYDFPDLFRHWNAGRWQAEGAPSILAEAWDRAQQEIATSTFELPDDQRREVERIYQKAASAFL